MAPDWIGSLMDTYGLWALGAGIFFEAMGLPLPGETMLVLASGLSAQGGPSIWAVALVGFVAATLGDNLGYLVGRVFGRPVLVARGGRIGITHERLERVERLLEHRGVLIIVFARFVILLRQLNGLAAGAVGMHWARFALANAVGAALWVAVWSSLAYAFGDNLHLLPRAWAWLADSAALLAPVAVLVLLVAWWRWVYRPRRRKLDAPPPLR